MRWWLVLLVVGNAHVVGAEEFSLPSVMDKRWAASTGYGAATLRARSDDAEQLLLVGFELAVRFRARPDLEVGLALGGSATREHGYGAIYADVRYRISAERPWNPYVFAGTGAASWDPDESLRLLLRAGTGLERRFRSWAFVGELQMSHVGGDSTVMPIDTQTTLHHFGAWGATLSVSAVYYWGGARRSRGFVP